MCQLTPTLESVSVVNLVIFNVYHTLYIFPEDENVDDPQNWQQGGGGGNQWQRRSSGANRSRQRNSRPKQARTDVANAAPAVPQPPKERPDAKHHLKV